MREWYDFLLILFIAVMIGYLYGEYRHLGARLTAEVEATDPHNLRLDDDEDNGARHRRAGY